MNDSHPPKSVTAEAVDWSTTKGIALIVEDQPGAREFLSGAVREVFCGLEIVTTKSIAETERWLKLWNGWGRTPSLRLALVDIGLPDGSGIRLLEQLSADEPTTLSLVVTIFRDDDHLFDALRAGAYGYLLKDDEPAVFLETLKRLQRDEPPLSPSVARRLLAHFHSPSKSNEGEAELTMRQRETLTLLAQGLTVPEAADRMGLSAQTVAGYVKIIYHKLHVSTRAEATREAVRRGLV